MKIPLSVLDTQWPGRVFDLVPALDSLGYHRYWASEHHGRRQSASPTVLTALAALAGRNMRVGSAGVLLRLTSAARVAQDFALLQLCFPGRIDLGVAPALPNGEFRSAYEKDVRVADTPGSYLDRLGRLAALVRGQAGPDGAQLPIGPQGEGIPQLWLCGKSLESAELAGQLGFSYAYHHHLALNDPRAVRYSREVVFKTYKDSFRAARKGDAPYFAVAAFGACARTAREAQRSWDRFRDSPKASFLGDPKECVKQLDEIARDYRADELVIDCFMSDFASRVKGLKLIMEAWRPRRKVRGRTK